MRITLLLVFAAPGLLLAEPCERTCIRLSFDDSGSYFYDYVVSRSKFLEMVEASKAANNQRALSETEAVSIAAEAVSLSANNVRIVHYFKRESSEGTVWLYRIGFEGLRGHEDVLVAPNRAVVRPKRFEGRMTAQPDCSNYRFNADAGRAGAG